MNDFRDKDLTPISRKHRLMAAALPMEENTLPGNASRSDRNGIGLVHCFICGSGVTPGKELPLQVKYQRENFPFFPFLQNQEPAPGAAEVSADGHALVCAVCHCFLAEQWNSFERSRTPIEKRMYWLKRPYQCDSRRIPQEWNISYDLERRISVGSQNFDGNESDFSSFSDNDNMSDQELDLVDRGGGSKDKCFRVTSNNSKVSKDGLRKSSTISVKNSPDSQRAIRYPVSVYAAQDTPKSDSTLPPRRTSKIMNHVSQSSVSLAQLQESLPQRCYDSPSVETPVQDNGIIMRNKQWLPERNAKHPETRQPVADNSCKARLQSPLFRHSHKGTDVTDAVSVLSPVGASVAAPGRRDATNTRRDADFRRYHGISSGGGDSDNSDNHEINITSDDERDVFHAERGVTEHREDAPSFSSSSSSSLSRPHRGERLTSRECACFICGSRLPQAGRFKVSVQKQERAASEPFFPFLCLHNPPPGAVPLSPGGSTLVCASCHSSLMQQWQGFQLADVPVLQRLYVVPLNTGAPTGRHSPPFMGGEEATKREAKLQQNPHRHPYALPSGLSPSTSTSAHGATREACYLCGQDCGREVKVAYARAGEGKARGSMYFPFINLLPCPPNARGVRDGRVHCCGTCHGILEDIWAAYRLCLSEELITSVNTFLGRYHQALNTAGSGGGGSSGGTNPGSRSLAPSATVVAPTGVPPGGGGGGGHHASVCYLCGSELGNSAERQIRVNPPGRGAEREPFFPFLTVHPPAPRARPPDATGLVSSCVLCYHDLLGQWAQHESQAAGSGTPASSPWSRQYGCDTFVCFFCRQEKRRPLGLRAVKVARLPVFLYAPRVSRTLVVDDGKQLTIGSCVDCKAVVLAGQNMKPDGDRIETGGGPTQASHKVRKADSQWTANQWPALLPHLH